MSRHGQTFRSGLLRACVLRGRLTHLPAAQRIPADACPERSGPGRSAPPRSTAPLPYDTIAPPPPGPSAPNASVGGGRELRATTYGDTINPVGIRTRYCSRQCADFPVRCLSMHKRTCLLQHTRRTYHGAPGVVKVARVMPNSQQQLRIQLPASRRLLEPRQRLRRGIRRRLRRALCRLALPLWQANATPTPTVRTHAR